MATLLLMARWSPLLRLNLSGGRRFQVAGIDTDATLLLKKFERLGALQALLHQQGRVKLCLERRERLTIGTDDGIAGHKQGTAVLVGNDRDVIGPERLRLGDDFLLIHANEGPENGQLGYLVDDRK